MFNSGIKVKPKEVSSILNQMGLNNNVHFGDELLTIVNPNSNFQVRKKNSKNPYSATVIVDPNNGIYIKPDSSIVSVVKDDKIYIKAVSEARVCDWINKPKGKYKEIFSFKDGKWTKVDECLDPIGDYIKQFNLKKTAANLIEIFKFHTNKVVSIIAENSKNLTPKNVTNTGRRLFLK